MKLVIDCENEHFEIECDADMTLAAMGRSSYHKIISAIARTLDSFLRAITDGNELARKKLWKDFKRRLGQIGIAEQSLKLCLSLIPFYPASQYGGSFLFGCLMQNRIEREQILCRAAIADPTEGPACFPAFSF